MGNSDGLPVTKFMVVVCSVMVEMELSFQPCLSGLMISLRPWMSFTKAAFLQKALISAAGMGMCRCRVCSRARTLLVTSDMSCWDFCR